MSRIDKGYRDSTTLPMLNCIQIAKYKVIQEIATMAKLISRHILFKRSKTRGYNNIIIIR